MTYTYQYLCCLLTEIVNDPILLLQSWLLILDFHNIRPSLVLSKDDPRKRWYQWLDWLNTSNSYHCWCKPSSPSKCSICEHRTLLTSPSGSRLLLRKCHFWLPWATPHFCQWLPVMWLPPAATILSQKCTISASRQNCIFPLSPPKKDKQKNKKLTLLVVLPNRCTITRTRANVYMHTPPSPGYFTRIMLVITQGAFTGCSHIPVPLSHFFAKALVLYLLLFLPRKSTRFPPPVHM